jgi:hypothetical protein
MSFGEQYSSVPASRTLPIAGSRSGQGQLSTSLGRSPTTVQPARDASRYVTAAPALSGPPASATVIPITSAQESDFGQLFKSVSSTVDEWIRSIDKFKKLVDALGTERDTQALRTGLYAYSSCC